MINYVIFTVVIDYLISICMISMIYKNQVMLRSQRIGFILSFSLILVVSTLELSSLLIDDKFLEFRYLNLAFINIYLILSPLVPILYAGSVTAFKHKSFKYVALIYILYVLFILLAIPFKLIFYIDGNNNYVSSPGYPVFICAYGLFKLYLVYICYIKIKKFQNTNWFALIVLLLAFIGGSGVQLYDSTIHTVWASITIILIVYYAYYNELCRQLDEMTDLYSHQAYLHRSSRLKIGEALIIMDCDKFKAINDTFGHAIGDECIIDIASCIKEAVKRNGICYRIGGDEFAVILKKDKDVELIVSDIKNKIEEKRNTNPNLPTLSIGYEIYDATMNYQAFKDLVDKSMYENKNI